MVDIPPGLSSREYKFPVFGILTMVLGIDSHIESDPDIIDDVEVEAIDVHESVFDKRKMGQFIECEKFIMEFPFLEEADDIVFGEMRKADLYVALVLVCVKVESEARAAFVLGREISVFPKIGNCGYRVQTQH